MSSTPPKRRNTPGAAPQHYVSRKMREVGTVPNDGLDAIVRRVFFRIKKNRSGLGCGSYVLIDDLARVFVLSEDSSSTPSMVARNTRFLVGLYAAGAKPKLPEYTDLVEDIEFALNGRSVP